MNKLINKTIADVEELKAKLKEKGSENRTIEEDNVYFTLINLLPQLKEVISNS